MDVATSFSPLGKTDFRNFFSPYESVFNEIYGSKLLLFQFLKGRYHSNQFWAKLAK